ncbi:hypothetical protein ACQ4LE_004364 [Meloidogyne hapla]|uniref:Probable pectate lyase F n=1 Tax=Meloidogyne hapla TaxID=6305 RepID=A0A1I8BRK9_MELHA
MQMLIISSLIIINSLIIFPKLSLAFNTKGAKFCNFPKPTSTEVRTETLKLSKDKDFGNKRIIFNGKKGTCRYSNNPQWEQAIILEDGVTISNLILGESPIGTASDIMCKGSCTLRNVFIENTCWRAFTFIGPSDVFIPLGKKDKNKYVFTVEGGGALDGIDKIMCQGAPGNTIVRNFCAVNNALGIHSAGRSLVQYSRHITIENSKFMGPMLEISGGNQNYHDKVTLRNIQIYGNNNPATKIKFVCSEYKGENPVDNWQCSFRPGEAGTCNTCKYPASAVKVIN